MTRHLGRHRDTNDQLAISFMLIPGQTTHALVTYIDTLNGILKREVMEAVSSLEAQRTNNLADVFARKTYADSGKSLLQVLQEGNRLTKVEIDEVLMTPDGNHRLPLRTVLEAMQAIPTAAVTERFNPHTYNTVAEGQNEQVGVARNLLVEADLLESDARIKREQAYKLAPSLRPASAEEILRANPNVTVDETGSVTITRPETANG